MFLTVRFFAEFSKLYTYKSDRSDIKKGDFVVVKTPTGKTVVKVEEVNVKTPHYQCKSIVKKVRL